ncbi:MAG: aminotransferase class V-fold PLP-dependent enzyme [Chryseotalea sp.]
MISFYPGPSQLDDAVEAALKKAVSTSMLSENHRSKRFEILYKTTIQTIRKKLSLPKSYTVLFASSATECWEIIEQSLIGNRNSLHLVNGAFGQKWFTYTQLLTNHAQVLNFGVDEYVPVSNFPQSPVICFTHNETSNGTYWPESALTQLRKNYPVSLLVADATSSLGGIRINFEQADVWFASAQKCLGLPAGLAVLFLSPRAVDVARTLNHHSHYNALPSMLAMQAKLQTTHTPNVLGIFLLNEILSKRKHIRLIDKQTRTRMHRWISYFKKSKTYTPYVKNSSVQSPTVLCIHSNAANVRALKKLTAKNGYTLGEGYGALKENTFRIANFPALKQKHIKGLQKYLLNLI